MKRGLQICALSQYCLFLFLSLSLCFCISLSLSLPSRLFAACVLFFHLLFRPLRCCQTTLLLLRCVPTLQCTAVQGSPKPQQNLDGGQYVVRRSQGWQFWLWRAAAATTANRVYECGRHGLSSSSDGGTTPCEAGDAHHVRPCGWNSHQCGWIMIFSFLFLFSLAYWRLISQVAF